MSAITVAFASIVRVACNRCGWTSYRHRTVPAGASVTQIEAAGRDLLRHFGGGESASARCPRGCADLEILVEQQKEAV